MLTECAAKSNPKSCHDEDPNIAAGTVLSHAETTPNGLVSLVAMKYNASCRRVDGSWRFSRREIQFLYYVPAEKCLQGLSRKQRLFYGGDWKDADYPEALPAWQDFDRNYPRDGAG